MPAFTVKSNRVEGWNESTTSNQWLAEPRPDHLRALVLDYLCHNCYTETAKAFAKDSAVRHLDKDGDEIVSEGESERRKLQGTSAQLSDDTIQMMLLRECVRTQILSGRVEEAMALLKEHFPNVLADDENYELDSCVMATAEGSSEKFQFTTGTISPIHLSLNLRILAFIEACRTVPLVYTPHRRSPTPPVVSTPAEATEVDEKYQTELLIRVRKLYASVNLLRKPEDRATYLQELLNVGGLLAYKVPEESPGAKYLHQERRDRVADQVNSAILRSANVPTISYLELAVRNTYALWAELHGLRHKIHINLQRPSGVKLPPGIKSRNTNGSEKDTACEAPPFDLQLFLDART